MLQDKHNQVSIKETTGLDDRLRDRAAIALAFLGLVRVSPVAPADHDDHLCLDRGSDPHPRAIPVHLVCCLPSLCLSLFLCADCAGL